MPRKKKTWKKEKNALLKQTKIITSRLMELNLTLDDYIYKNKPISVSTAELYIQEVSSYSAICCRDQRSLQVIEKITRCMKGIIAEAQERNQRGIDHSIEDERQGREYMTAPSPVYSMPDDDVQLTQRGREIGKLNDNNMQVEDVIDLCSDGDVDDFENNKSGIVQDNIVANIQRNISKLFIGSTEVEPNAVNYSQNIIDDTPLYHNTCSATNPQGIFINDTTIEQSQSLVLNFNNSPVMITPNISVRTDNNYSKTTSDSFIHQTATDTLVDSKMRGITYGTKAHVTKQHTDNTKLSNNVSRELENISNVSPYQNSVAIRNYTAIDTPKEYAINENCVWKDIALNISKIVNNKRSDTLSVCKENVIPKKTKGRAVKTKHDSVTKEGSKTTNKPTRKAPRTLKNKTLPKIYSEDTLNDLSWIENIRYVREVAKEEYDTNTANLRDDFWQNYTLPDMWNDREFDY